MAQALETTAELDYTDAIAWLGLRITPPRGAPRAYLGIASRTENGKTVVSGIRRGSPAASAGMSLLDEVVAIDGEPLTAGQLATRLERISPGSKVTFTIRRGDSTRNMDVVLITDPAHGWELSPLPTATRTQSQRVEAWLTK
jgi:predicted metalloprotease with PDZ domain